MKCATILAALSLLTSLSTSPVLAAPKVAYLGVTTATADESVKAQLSLENGVTVIDVRDDGPSAGVLQKHDILTKMDDQILFNPEQLSALLGTKKKGDQVRLAVVRKGARLSQTVTLGEREEEPPGRGDSDPRLLPPLEPVKIELPDDLPAEAREAIEKALKNAGTGAKAESSARVIINGNEVTAPGATTQTVSQSSSSTVWTDGHRTYQISRNNGKTTVKVTENGKTLLEGPFDTMEDRKKIPREMREKLEEIDKKVRAPRGKDEGPLQEE